MTYDVVLRDGSRIPINKERNIKLKKILGNTEDQPEWLEIGAWGFVKLNQIIYVQANDRKFRPDGY